MPQPDPAPIDLDALLAEADDVNWPSFSVEARMIAALRALREDFEFLVDRIGEDAYYLNREDAARFNAARARWARKEKK